MKRSFEFNLSGLYFMLDQILNFLLITTIGTTAVKIKIYRGVFKRNLNAESA